MDSGPIVFFILKQKQENWEDQISAVQINVWGLKCKLQVSGQLYLVKFDDNTTVFSTLCLKY